MTPGVLIITGPTASGKSALALALAERFGAEIVGADSRQIYRGMSIGTAAPSLDDRARVPHHLVEFLDPRERYSAARFAADALAAIDAIHMRGRRAIVAGGTGFYVRALSGDVQLSSAFDPVLRERLAREARAHPTDVLAGWLRALAPARAAAIAPSDPYRITRALEIALAERGSNRDAAAAPAIASLRSRGIPHMKLAIDVPRDALASRIAHRVDGMLASGFLAEAARIGAGAVAADAVGYREALAFLAGFSTRAELRAQLIRNTARYAKRQATWLRTEPAVLRIGDAERFDAAVRAAGALPGWA